MKKKIKKQAKSSPHSGSISWIKQIKKKQQVYYHHTGSFSRGFCCGDPLDPLRGHFPW